MINALRGLRDNEPGAAKVDSVECTSSIARYECDRQLVHVNLFDIPGSGTDKFPSAEYFA
jgi:hypothetical protein